MPRVVEVDHLTLSVSDLDKSKAFYGKVLGFLGFKLLDEYPTMVGWTDGRTRLWIAAADAQGGRRRHRKGDVGFHHYAWQLRSRADVDAFEAFLRREGFPVADPAGEYYDDYYAVFFTDPDGMRLEAMKWGEAEARAKRAAGARKGGKRTAGKRRRRRA